VDDPQRADDGLEHVPVGRRPAQADGGEPVRALEKGERPKVRKRPGRTLQPDEIRALLASATSDRYRALIATAIFTGCRLQELLALRWQDFDLEAGELEVRYQLSRKGRRLEVVSADD
jgi:integrase